MKSPAGPPASSSAKRKSGPVLNLQNLIFALLGFSITYVVVAYFHIGKHLRGDSLVSTTGPDVLRDAEAPQHAQVQDRLQTAIEELEREHKRLQNLVEQSEVLLQQRKYKKSEEVNNQPTRVTKEKGTARKEKIVRNVEPPHTLESKVEPRVVIPAPTMKPVSNPIITNAIVQDNHAAAHTFVLDSTVPAEAQGVSSSGSKEPRAMMVVCGTDGSGTRSVVQTLTRLGVLMTSEDPETYDIHGDLMGGWPPMVKPVLGKTHSLNYEPEKIDPSVHNVVSTGLRRLIEKAESDSHKPESHKLAVGGALPRRTGTDATRVKFGFKAPVAMTLAPYWAYLTPHFKLLHVVRDGRDIAFSANQGPVQKFYRDMYGGSDPKDKEKMLRKDSKVKAMQLWADWNSQLREWSVQRADSLRSDGGSGGGKTFSYLSFHTEDLVSENLQVRYSAISSLAQWVGSTLSQEAICCVAQTDATFMGSHDRTQKSRIKGSQAREVSRRYGKWRGLVGKNQGLYDGLHRVGADTLRLFGYRVGAPAPPPPGGGGEAPQAIGGHVCEATATFLERCKSL